MHATAPTCSRRHKYTHRYRQKHTWKRTHASTHTCSRCIRLLLLFWLSLYAPFSPCSPSCIHLFYPPSPSSPLSRCCTALPGSLPLTHCCLTYLTCKLSLYLCHAQEVLSISLNTVTHIVRREGEREREWQGWQDLREKEWTEIESKWNTFRKRRRQIGDFCLV